MGGLFWQGFLAGKGCSSHPTAFVFLNLSFSTHRRALYIVTYLLFPINVLVGVLAGVWRMVISGLYNAIHFCQLDISLLNRNVETFDPGRFLCSTSASMMELPGDMARDTWRCQDQGWLHVLVFCAQKGAGGTTGASGFSCCLLAPAFPPVPKGG